MPQIVGMLAMACIFLGAAAALYFAGLPVIFAVVLAIGAVYVVAGVLGRIAERRRTRS